MNILNLIILEQHKDFIECNINFLVSILTFPTIIESLFDFEKIFGIVKANQIVKFTPLTFPESLSLDTIDKQHIKSSTIDDLDTMGYNTAPLKNILNQTNVYTDDELIIIQDQRRNLFTRLKKYKNMDVREILPWFEMPESFD